LNESSHHFRSDFEADGPLFGGFGDSKGVLEDGLGCEGDFGQDTKGYGDRVGKVGADYVHDVLQDGIRMKR